MYVRPDGILISIGMCHKTCMPSPKRNRSTDSKLEMAHLKMTSCVNNVTNSTRVFFHDRAGVNPPHLRIDVAYAHNSIPRIKRASAVRMGSGWKVHVAFAKPEKRMSTFRFMANY